MGQFGTLHSRLIGGRHSSVGKSSPSQSGYSDSNLGGA